LLEAYGLNQNRPRIDLFGAHHIDRCARNGRGALLWVSHFVHHALVTKRALRDDGRAVHHISRPEHGFSKTRFGINVLNRIRTGVEDGFSEERLVLGEGSLYRETIKRARRLLAEGRLFSVTVGGWEGYQLVYVPFLSGYLPLATGAISMCRICRADLLPVFTVWNGESNRFEVHIDEPLTVDYGGKNLESTHDTASQYADRLLPWVEKYPGQWRDWHRILAPEELERLIG
jgi:lauroyl/myristoyl acyltransferase